MNTKSIQNSKSFKLHFNSFYNMGPPHFITMQASPKRVNKQISNLSNYHKHHTVNLEPWGPLGVWDPEVSCPVFPVGSIITGIDNHQTHPG